MTRLRWVNANLPKSPVAHARRDGDRSICAMAAAVSLDVLQEVVPPNRSTTASQPAVTSSAHSTLTHRACMSPCHRCSQVRRMKLPWDEETCEAAAAGGLLDVLQWAREQGCPWDPPVCAAAARGGHLHVIQLARTLPTKERCPWDEETCAAAAGGGHLELLRWVRQRRAPWDENTCLLAAE